MLAVFWAAGSLLFAADGWFTASTKPAAQAPATPVAEAGSVSVARLAAEDEDAKAAEPVPTESAAEAAKAEDAKEDAAASRDEAQSEDGTDEVASEKPASSEPKSAADAGASPRRFVPSEQVRADFDVSFPIDI